MVDVFVSYSRKDAASARALAEALENRGMSVFLDRSIPAGSSYEDVIEAALEETKAVVVLWSRHSVRSAWVRAEAAEGARRGILVPATLDGEQPPLRYRIAQTANLSEWATGTATEPFRRYLNDITEIVRRSTVPGDVQITQIESGSRTSLSQIEHVTNIRPTVNSLQRCLWLGVGCAWSSSLALAITMAYDYGVVTSLPAFWAIAYNLTLFGLVGGAIASGALGVLSLRREFLLGSLQGFLWPVVAAIGQLLVLMNTAPVIRSLPFASEAEGLLAFVLSGSLGPAFLTAAAVITNRSLPGR